MAIHSLDTSGSPRGEALDLSPIPALVLSALATGETAITYANESARSALAPHDGNTWFPRAVSTIFDTPATEAIRSMVHGEALVDAMTVGVLDHVAERLSPTQTIRLSRLSSGEVVAQLLPVADPSAADTALLNEQRFRAALLELNALANTAQSDELFYQRLIERAVDVVPGAQAGSIQVSVEGSNRFRFVAALGYDLEGLQRFDLEQQHMFRDATNPRARIVHDLHAPSRSPEMEEWLDTVGRLKEIKVNVSAPVVSNGYAVAFLSLDNFEDPSAMTDASVEMTTVLGALLGELLRRRKLETELREEREAYLHLALHDPLTGLANRRNLDRTLKQRLSSARGRNAGSALLFIDIDDFKSTNDRLGHDMGDNLLKEVARGLHDAVRAGDMVGRWGGDEFLVLPVGVDSPEEVYELADRILTRFEQELLLGDAMPFRARLTIGAAWSDDSILKADQLIRAADAALYEAKAAGKGVCRLKTI